MLTKLREGSQGESGFTLVELLVVMLIIGLLAAIAIPAFFNQKNKATDTQAKLFDRTAETSMETYSTDNGGNYTGATAAKLQAIEPTLNGATISAVTVPADAPDVSNQSYKVSVASGTGNVFSITRHDNSTISLTCTTAGSNGCLTGGIWG